MIQRIQSIYLFLACILGVLANFWADLWKSVEIWLQAEDNLLLSSLLLASSVLALISVFLFKNRKFQIRVNGINIIMNILLIGLMVYNLINLPGGFDSEKGIGLLTPFAMILLLFLANKAIIKDEKLVKSVDRIR